MVTKASICASDRQRTARTSGSRSVRSTSASRYSEVTSRSRLSMTASSRATAADLRWRRSRPRISRLESRTALARAGTPDSADGSVHDDVDATRVPWPPLTTHLLRKQSQPDLWREKALDQPQAILRRPAPSLNENPIDLFASSRHGVARYHDDRHPPKQKAVGLPDPRAGLAPAAVPWPRRALAESCCSASGRRRSRRRRST